MGKSSVQIVDHPNGKLAQVKGVIDGTFDLRPLMGDHEIVLFDLDGVTRITSFGVREWRTALAQINAQYICFVNCHPSVLSQFNLVPGFACGGELISFYLPYICPNCNHVAEELLDLRNHADAVESLTPPTLDCANCGSEMEFDDLPAAYFKYPRSVPAPNPPAAANAMIDRRTPEAPARELTVRKEVEDTVTAFWLSGNLDNKRALRRLTEGVEGDVLLELSDLDGITDDGLLALGAFLREVGQAYLCRVPGALCEQLTRWLDESELPGAAFCSLKVTVACPSCLNPVDLELDSDRLAALLDDDNPPYKHCPACAQRLMSKVVPQTITDSVARRPLVEPPEAVQIYLRHRSTFRSDSSPGGLRTYTAAAQLLFGNYRILRRLGRGGMGEVLLARYVGVEKFEKLVVIKRIRRDYLDNPTAMQEFQREARVTARLSHPNIVQIFDFGKYEDEYFFAMEYVKGIDLRRALRLCSEHNMLWPVGLCLRVVSDVCAGLEAAHNYVNDAGVTVPIFHRDVSPENIIISVDGAVKLMDFGIAKAADSSVNTGAGVFKGKHAYSAPEQLDATIAADHRTDIYATGIVMFELLSLRRYFGDEPTLNTVYAATQEPPQLIKKERDDVPPKLQQIFERATASDRGERYQSAMQFREDLEQLMKSREYPTSHDLASWVRKILTLLPDEDAEIHTPGLKSLAQDDTARLQKKSPHDTAVSISKVRDDDG